MKRRREGLPQGEQLRFHSFSQSCTKLFLVFTKRYQQVWLEEALKVFGTTLVERYESRSISTRVCSIIAVNNQ